MRLVGRLLIFAGVVAAGVAIYGCGFGRVEAAQARPDPLKAVLAQMDAASAKFTSAQADLKQEIFTKAVQDTETQTGRIYFLRKAGTTQMGMTLLAPDAKPGSAPSQVVEFKDGKLHMLNTGTNQVDEFSATGKNQALAQTIMTLGFGGSGRDLQKSWTIADKGPESLNEGGKTVQTERLDLVSKETSISNTYSEIDIWIDPMRDVALKQVAYEASNGKPTGDTRTVYYGNIRLNQPVDAAPFAIKCKGSCNVVQH